QAQLFHQGAPAGLRPRTRAGRDALARVELSPAGRALVLLALRMIATIDRELAPLGRELRSFAGRQPGSRALTARLSRVWPPCAPATSGASSATRRSPPSSATGTPRRRLPLPPSHASARARLPVITQMLCGRLPHGACRQAAMAWTAPKDRAAASNLSRGSHPIDHLVAG